jgi:hypothetical protein
MTTNPFWEYSQDALQNRRVEVVAESATYTGVLTKIGYNARGYLLQDVELDDGSHRDSVVVHDPEAIRLAPEQEDNYRVETVRVDDIRQNRYSVRTFDDVAFAKFVRQVRDYGGMGNLPVVREIDDKEEAQYEIVSGNRRREALDRAGLGTHPVIVWDCSEWEAAERFVEKHFPLPDDDDEEFYSPREMREAYALLEQDWDREQLRAHPSIQANLATLEVADEDLDDFLGTISPDEDGGERDEKKHTVSGVVEALNDETEVPEEEIKDDVDQLQEYELSLGAIKGALRKKYRS